MGHVYCSSCNDNKIKEDVAKKSDEWVESDHGWKCPECNKFISKPTDYKTE